MFGGSADLAGSNLTLWSGAKGITAKDGSGNYCFYGVREFGMSAIMNGGTTRTPITFWFLMDVLVFPSINNKQMHYDQMSRLRRVDVSDGLYTQYDYDI